jgi:hypothetical protein
MVLFCLRRTQRSRSQGEGGGNPNTFRRRRGRDSGGDQGSGEHQERISGTKHTHPVRLLGND